MPDRPSADADLALRRLRKRRDVRLVESVARQQGISVRVTGGAVRDAFLKRRSGDLDLVLAPQLAQPFAEALTRALRSRVLPLGQPPRRVLRVLWPGEEHEIDVWEALRGPREDLLRRDFTVNALAFDLPSGHFDAPEGALQDLAVRRLVPPRDGVLMEDPLRVLRAARLLAELPGFRLGRSARGELVRAARALGQVAPERRLAELDRLLSASREGMRRALFALEEWGALAALLPGVSAADRRQGLRRAACLGRPNPPVARALLLSSLPDAAALGILAEWRVPRRERRLTVALRALRLGRPARPPNRREIVETVRAVHPFVREASRYLEAVGRRGTRLLATSLRRVASRPSRLARLVHPRRPLETEEVAALLSASGPALGKALEALDVALAAGEVRRKKGARRFLLGLAQPDGR